MQNRVVIIGAGPTGLCLSLALARRGLQVDLVDAQSAEALSEPAFDGREVALTHASLRVLRDIGVWQHIDPADTAPLRRARVMDADREGFDVSPDAFGGDQLGMFAANHAIRAAAWKQASADPRIDIHTGTPVDSVACRADVAHAELADGTRLDGALLVAADSRFSRTRQSMGIATHMHDFGKSMLLCRMRHARSNEGIAREWFGRGQTRALLPLDEQLCSLILTLPAVEVERIKALPEAEFNAEITARCEGLLGDMQLASSIHCYPMVATWARRFTATRFALAGDAAVGMHPVTAHGFNLALASVEHLSRAAGDGWQRHRDAGHAGMLASYGRRHRISATLLFAGTQTVAKLFADDRALAQPLRRGILRAMDRLPMARRALAADLMDDSPRTPSPLRHLRKTSQVLRPRLGTGDSPLTR